MPCLLIAMKLFFNCLYICHVVNENMTEWEKMYRWGYLYKFSLYYPLKMTPLCWLGFLTFLFPSLYISLFTVFLTLCPIDHLGLVVIGGYTHKVTTVLTLHLKQPKASPTFPDIPWDAYWTFILGSGHILFSYSKFLWFSSNDSKKKQVR